MSGSGSTAAPSAAVRQQAEDACTTMQAALAALKDSQDASCPAPRRPQLQAASQALRMEVAKVGLLYNQAGSPSDAEAGPLIDGFQAAVCTLCMLYTGLAAAPGGGPTLRASLHATATSVVEACVALVRWVGLVGNLWKPQEARLCSAGSALMAQPNCMPCAPSNVALIFWPVCEVSCRVCS